VTDGSIRTVVALSPPISGKGWRIALCVTALAVCTSACSRDPELARLKYVSSGDGYAAAGKLPEAIIEYRNAVDQDPRSAEVREKLADAYARANDPSKALDEYIRAADLQTDGTAAALKAGGLLLLGGRFDDARVWAEKALAREPRNLDAQILLANAHAGLTDLDAAVLEIEEAIRLDPERGLTYTNLGAFEARRGQPEAAERAFKRAVELDGRSGVAYLALANFYWSAARWLEAEDALQKAVTLDADNPIAHRVLAAFYVATNRVASAEPHLKRVLELTNAPAAGLALAEHYSARKDHVAARAVLERLAAAPETASGAEVRLAALDRDLGRPEEASARLKRVLAADAGNLEALLLTSTFLLADRKVDEALANAVATTGKHPESAAAYFTLGRVQAARFQTQAAIAAYQSALGLNPRASDTKLAIARLQLAAGSADASVQLAQETVDVDPDSVPARLVLIRGLLARREIARAEREIETLAARFPDLPAVHAQRGILLGIKDDRAGAREHFERALALQPDSMEAFGGLVALDLAERQFAGARTRLAARLASHPGDLPTLMMAAQAYGAMADWDEAERLLRRVIASQPAYLAAYGALAQVFVKQGRLNEALAEFEELARRDPRPVAALTLAGIILEGRGDAAAARERYERALETDPEAPVAANNLAWMYAHSGGNLDLALQLARTAHNKLRDVPEASHTLGVIYYKKNLLPEAVRTLQEAVALRPASAVYHYHLGLALSKSGDGPGTTRHLTRALGLDADFEGAADARAVLASLAVR
jgi:tetratricopeptide (TPR) repeat protein